MNTTEGESNDWQKGFAAGRRHGFAIAALVVSLVSFLSLLGAEKALTAIVFGWIALKGAERGSLPNRLGKSAIAIGCIFMVTVATVLVLFWKDVVKFVDLLQKLS
jgi:hypothetical protein